MRCSGLSKGGLYHHYKSTEDIFHDLMKQGNEFRFAQAKEFFSENSHMDEYELIMETTVDKMIDENEYKPLYAMFLLEAEKSEKLKRLYDEMIEESKEAFLGFAAESGIRQLEVLARDEFIAFVNSVILSVELAGNRRVFLENKEFLKDIVRNYIAKNYLKEEER